MQSQRSWRCRLPMTGTGCAGDRPLGQPALTALAVDTGSY
jgi:hypothetical protein